MNKLDKRLEEINLEIRKFATQYGFQLFEALQKCLEQRNNFIMGDAQEFYLDKNDAEKQCNDEILTILKKVKF